MQVKDAIEARRALRIFAEGKVAEDKIRQLQKAVKLAPSCFNNQPWRFVFVDDKEKLADFQSSEALSKGNEWAYKAPLIAAVFTKADLDCIIRDRQYFLYDTGIATGMLMLQAQELGLIAHPIAGFSPRKVRKLLNIPDDFNVICLIIIGRRPSGPSSKERPERLPDSDLFFENTYSAF